MSEIFVKTMQAFHRAKKVTPFTGTLLALDPGETTGVFVAKATPTSLEVLKVTQVQTWPMEKAVFNFADIINTYRPDFMVNESYRVYDWKADDHKWSPVNTVRVIGCIDTLALQHTIPQHEQSAQIAKNFCTDDFLKKMGYYYPGLKHGRDAVRHGLYYLCFGA